MDGRSPMHKGLSVLEAPMVQGQDQRSSRLWVGVRWVSSAGRIVGIGMRSLSNMGLGYMALEDAR